MLCLWHSQSNEIDINQWRYVFECFSEFLLIDSSAPTEKSIIFGLLHNWESKLIESFVHFIHKNTHTHRVASDMYDEMNISFIPIRCALVCDCCCCYRLFVVFFFHGQWNEPMTTCVKCDSICVKFWYATNSWIFWCAMISCLLHIVKRYERAIKYLHTARADWNVLLTTLLFVLCSHLRKKASTSELIAQSHIWKYSVHEYWLTF